MERFVNRKKDLEFLQNKYGSGKAELIIIFGRRRIGKSELARKSLEERKETIYYQATETTPSIQIEEFIDSIRNIFPEVKNIRKNWKAILEFLGKRETTVIIDEFPYLIESDSSVPSKFQRIWDQKLKDSKIKLVLIGSSISIMEDKVLSGGSPLHGRRTGQLDLKPLRFKDAEKFFMKYSPINKVMAWSIFGGTPHYLKSIDNNKSIKENVKDLILSERGLLRNEPEFILRTELEKPSRYMSILKAISKGKTRRNEIAQEVGVNGSSIGSYLSKLQTLRLIEREVPVTDDPLKSRSGIFKVREHLFNFWFRFVYGKEDQISLSKDPYEEIIESKINDYVSSHFEILCRRKLPELLSKEYKKIGRWWYRDQEIDLVGITDRGKVLGECKFSNSKMDKRMLANLENKEEKIKLGGETYYALFSKSGFTEDIKEEANERKDLYLFNLENII